MKWWAIRKSIPFVFSSLFFLINSSGVSSFNNLNFSVICNLFFCGVVLFNNFLFKVVLFCWSIKLELELELGLIGLFSKICDISFEEFCEQLDDWESKK